MGNGLGLLTPNGACEKLKQEVFGGTTLALYTLRLGHEERNFVVCVPEHLTADQRCGCVFFAHGIGGTAWHGAKEDTEWVRVARERSMVVVFLQSKGVFFDEQRRNSAGKLVWAASSWEATYNVASDLLYVETVHDAVVTQLFAGVIDRGAVYFCGFESGGMFAWPVACAFGGTLFAAVCAYNGGVDESTLSDRKSNPIVMRTKKGPMVPVWLLVGESYEHKARTDNAVKAFRELHWDVRLDVVKGGAEWPKGVLEDEVVIWFQSARDESLANHLSPGKRA